MLFIIILIAHCMFHSFFYAIIFFCSFGCFSYAEEISRHVLVSVVPHKFFVEKIAGDTVSVGLIVPAGASPHTFEPTPKQIIAASKADIWFCIGEGFEKRAIAALKSYRPMLDIVDLREGLSMIATDPQSGCCCHANSQDLHIWLSPRLAQIQVAKIAEALTRRYPENRQKYEEKLQLFLVELDALDKEITKILSSKQSRTILVSHPAYAYFCRDYHLSQMSVEFEGKDPTPQQLNRILIYARQAHINKVYVQAQYSSKGARLIAQEIGAEVIMLDPYSENYLDSMLEIARQFNQ